MENRNNGNGNGNGNGTLPHRLVFSEDVRFTDLTAEDLAQISTKSRILSKVGKLHPEAERREIVLSKDNGDWTYQVQDYKGSLFLKSENYDFRNIRVTLSYQ